MEILEEVRTAIAMAGSADTDHRRQRALAAVTAAEGRIARCKERQLETELAAYIGGARNFSDARVQAVESQLAHARAQLEGAP
jgi:hypothetical protein